MKVASITHLLSILVGTVATVASTSSTDQTNPTSDLAPYGSGFYYEGEIFITFCLPNSDFTSVGIWSKNKPKFSYEVDKLFGSYEPSDIPFDLRTGSSNLGVSMKADLKFNEEDKYAQIIMTGSNTTAFVDDVFEFTVLLLDLPNKIEKRLNQEFTVSITMGDLATMADIGTVPTVAAS